MAKYIFITGGVMSALGKGITGAALGSLLEGRGYRVLMKKFDPYLNIDPGTMSPFEHGEVFVTEDGTETDLDLGHYERFLSSNTNKYSNITSGKVYDKVLEKERRGDYLGQTVQVIPHITDMIKERITKGDDDYDIVIIEVGGTVGDIESLPFLEAIRQFKYDAPTNSVVYVHVTYVPYLETSGEMKTKPTQHSVQKLMEIGIMADILVCRSRYPLNQDTKSKTARFCNLRDEDIINAFDVASIYEIPIMLNKEGMDNLVLRKLQLDEKPYTLDKWYDISNRIKDPKHEVTVAMVGKYVNLKDTYISLREALNHAGIHHQTKIQVKLVDSEGIKTDEDARNAFANVSGILTPGGFGERGVEGKIRSSAYARENNIPYFGICLGMQVAIIDFARNVLGLADANSQEFAPFTPNPVIHYMAGQEGAEKGGTMRLGAYECELDEGSLARTAYGVKTIHERHRHRLEVNQDYLDRYSEQGLVISGVNPGSGLPEVAEIPGHPWFLGCQFHPEFKSKPTSPHPLFVGFISAAINHSSQNG